MVAGCLSNNQVTSMKRLFGKLFLRSSFVLSKSVVCRAEHFFEPWYGKWAERLGVDDQNAQIEQRNLHRKSWEWAAITQALFERGKLKPGMRGLCFAVGKEKLPSLFASMGCDITATDIGRDDIAANWRNTGQYAGAAKALFYEEYLSEKEFNARVTYQHADMRDLDPAGIEQETYDFIWSSCSFEHLGNLEAGLDFVLNANRFLKRGGIAVHTTEFNISSNTETIESGETVIYRETDLRELERRLSRRGAKLAALDLDSGAHEYDLAYDYAPYHGNGRMHIKLKIGDFICTSVLLIVQN